ncbi:arsenical pump-driving ATPase [Bacillus sp. DJP31]|uniref:arsenical pump-driving ATPase n=1 Tax=Bacillus sp. DJP31 TaxID=3409789 RepID=UPI003BB72DB7
MFQTFHPSKIDTTPFLFFTGKGGVGKTSTACATAVSFADRGKKVLLVSTDPASNLQDVFNIEISNQPMEIPQVKNLYACNLDPEEAAAAYRERVVGPFRGKLPDSVVSTMEEQMSGACTVEIAAFDEFTNLLANEQIIKEYDHIIFDTAPTGHTLRLLQLPTAWSGFLEENSHGASCLGPLAGLAGKKELYAETMRALSNPKQTTLVLVTRPEKSSLYEAQRASTELKEIGIANQCLIVNGLLQDFVEHDKVSEAFYARQRSALANKPVGLNEVTTYSLPFVSFPLTGISNLRDLFSENLIPAESESVSEITLNKDTFSTLESMVSAFSSNGTRIIFTMGKGGVGKTTVASMIAVGLVEKGHKVHLTTTDPASHLDLLFEETRLNDNLSISRVDPAHEVELYKAEVLSTAMEHVDEEGLAYLKEDLNSPCTEEIAVFRAFAKIVERSLEEIVVIDTAPTGHTLLLLDAAQSYHKEVARSTGEVPASVQNLLPRLRNPKETSVVIVTLAEATPVLEAKRLQEDLKRAEIVPLWWVINQSLFSTDTIDPVLKGRAAAERQWIQTVSQELADNCAIIPCLAEEITGYEKLKRAVEN